ncbi:MAG: helix-turn-helix transcriptional regulator [Ruminococcus sp.]|nr:helix-turn-helix transcriptional regulator [Ruminococcus sp.]
MATLAMLRVRAGLTQDNVARALGVTQGAVSIWERGDGKPKLSKIPTLAKLYGTSEQAILAACMEKPPQSSYYVMKRKRR